MEVTLSVKIPLGASPLTTQTVAKLRRLPLEERKMYAQELRARYEVRSRRLRKSSQRMAQEWSLHQRLYFRKCIDELDNVVNDRETYHTYSQAKLEL